ncbi:MAG TPA: leucine-rich repeat domain-containing protein [bacterium]|nr:leucine-rich repeat domain-containing protein [bacterium]
MSIVDNQVESLEPLRTLTKLTFLKLNNNKIKDLEPLSGLTELNALYLMNNYIDSLTPLYGCKKITALSINGNCITDERQFEDIQAQLPNAGISGAVLAAQTPEKCQ